MQAVTREHRRTNLRDRANEYGYKGNSKVLGPGERRSSEAHITDEDQGLLGS